MGKKKIFKKRSKAEKQRIKTFVWLLISFSGMFLFTFGLKDLFDAWNWTNLGKVGTGAFMVFVAIWLRQFRTDNSVAIKGQ